jgi:CheY-like chemotaxis protein
VQGDDVRLYQVLINLAHNAIKFTERGQVIVRVEPGAAEEVSFRITDTGPGLPVAVLESLNLRAERGHFCPQQIWNEDGSRLPSQVNAEYIAADRNVRAPAPASAGLGLRISRRLIELLGGCLSAASTPSGTTLSFSLRLPAATGAGAGRVAEEPPDLACYSALVVEDVPSNQTVLAAFLEKTGMRSDLAATAAEAREKLRGARYDFAFVDIQLPDADGAELAAAMQKLQPDLRLVAVTAQVSPAIRATCESAGVRAFVPKPIAPAELYEKLRRLTEPRVEAVERLFDHDRARVSEYVLQLDRECEGWEAELGPLIAKPDPERLRRLHHRMKNALGQLDLWKLDLTLNGLARAMEQRDNDNIRDLGAAALRLIAAVRQFTGANRLSTSQLMQAGFRDQVS